MVKVKVFDGNDAAYQEWLANNPKGYVINVSRNLTPSYMVLHKSNCDFNRNHKRMAHKGGFTERAYLKVCFTEISELREWVRSHGRNDGALHVNALSKSGRQSMAALPRLKKNAYRLFMPMRKYYQKRTVVTHVPLVRGK